MFKTIHIGYDLLKGRPILLTIYGLSIIIGNHYVGLSAELDNTQTNIILSDLQKMNLQLPYTFVFFCLIVTCTLLLLTNSSLDAQEISDGEKKRIERISKLVDNAGQLFKKEDFAGSAEKIRDAQKYLLRMADSGQMAVMKKLKNDYDRIAKARELLEAKGESFEDLPTYASLLPDEDSEEKDGSDTKGSGTKNSSTEGGEAGDATMVSFTKEVAPILIEHCGQCHIQKQQGKYDMQTYTSLKKGTRKGIAVKPRDVAKSRMITLIENGKMPPKRVGELPEEKLEIIKEWIEQGAKFDGSNKEKKANLTSYVKSEGSGSKVDGGTGIKSRSGIKNRSLSTPPTGRGNPRGN